MTRTSLPLMHLLLAVAVMAVWGTNFVVIKVALEHLPALLMATLRFTLVFVPFAMFVKRPATPWRNLALYGVLIGAGQFGLLFIAMKSDITPGLASLLVQTQIFFTIGLSMRSTAERMQPHQWIALVLASLGLVIIFAHTEGGATPLGIALVLAAALCWALGNQIARSSGAVNFVSYVVWSSVFAVPPLLLFSLLFEGWPSIENAVRNASLGTWEAVAWQSIGNTIFGYSAWAWLLARHSAAVVTPMALLVPVFGMGASALYLGEPLQPWKLLAAALVMTGLAVNLFGPLLWRH